MTESEIQAAEERAQPRRETTREIARRVLERFAKSSGLPPTERPATLIEDIRCEMGWPLAESSADLAELLRRAASGECDREGGA